MPALARDIALRCCKHDHEVRAIVHCIVIMPDHVHLALTPLIDQSRQQQWTLAEIMQGIKGASAHAINKALGRRGTVWQAESFDHILRSHEDLNSKLMYIFDNPVRAGLVKSPRDYPWLWTPDPELFSLITEIKRKPE
jgi:REP element-mobilizing transposase RayT